MKRLLSKVACAALGLSLCFGASASPRIPVALAPVSSSLTSVRPPVISSHIIIIIIVTRSYTESLEHVDQSAQFDRTN